MPFLHPTFGPLAQKLAADPAIIPSDHQAVAGLPVTVRSLAANSDIIREGDRPSQCCLVIEGYLHRFKIIEKGKRQIMSFHVPGDIPDLQGLQLEVSDHYLGSLSRATVAFIPHAALAALLFTHPRLGAFFWREALIDAAIFREWIVNLGRRDGPTRVAHLICEQAVKLKGAHLHGEVELPWFLTQRVMADATGLSDVHVNRVMRTLAEKGLVRAAKRLMVIPNWAALAAEGGFDDTYLHIRGAQPHEQKR